MRLIDADKLLAEMNDRYNEKAPIVSDTLAEGFMQMEKLIKEQPTAYDIDKIVEELKESSEKITEYDIDIDDYVSQFVVGIHKAIEIVRQIVR